MRTESKRTLIALGLLLASCSRGGIDPVEADLASPRPDLSSMPGPQDLSTRDLAMRQPAVPSFAAPVPFRAPGTYGGMTVADVNRDGVSDIVVAIEQKGGFAVHLGKGDGTLTDLGDQAGPAASYASTFVITADLNLDGNLDIVVSSFSPSMMLTALGKGDGTFVNAARLSMPVTAQGLAVADFDSDGKPDLAVGCGQTNNACLLLGKGDGTFHPVKQFAVGQAPIGTRTADLDGDKKPDILLAAYEEPAVSLLFGKGDGSFRPLVNLPNAASPARLVVADLNRDGAIDIITSSDRGASISVHLATGSGAFAPERVYPTGSGCYGVLAEDLDGDGRIDIAAADRRESVAIFPGRGDGTLANVALIKTELLGVNSVATGDA